METHAAARGLLLRSAWTLLITSLPWTFSVTFQVGGVQFYGRKPL
jgi:hypothetical protein